MPGEHDSVKPSGKPSNEEANSSRAWLHAAAAGVQLEKMSHAVDVWEAIFKSRVSWTWCLALAHLQLLHIPAPYDSSLKKRLLEKPQYLVLQMRQAVNEHANRHHRVTWSKSFLAERVLIKMGVMIRDRQSREGSQTVGLSEFEMKHFLHSAKAAATSAAPASSELAASLLQGINLERRSHTPVRIQRQLAADKLLLLGRCGRWEEGLQSSKAMLSHHQVQSVKDFITRRMLWEQAADLDQQLVSAAVRDAPSWLQALLCVGSDVSAEALITREDADRLPSSAFMWALSRAASPLPRQLLKLAHKIDTRSTATCGSVVASMQRHLVCQTVSEHKVVRTAHALAAKRMWGQALCLLAAVSAYDLAAPLLPFAVSENTPPCEVVMHVTRAVSSGNLLHGQRALSVAAAQLAETGALPPERRCEIQCHMFNDWRLTQLTRRHALSGVRRIFDEELHEVIQAHTGGETLMARCAVPQFSPAEGGDEGGSVQEGSLLASVKSLKTPAEATAMYRYLRWGTNWAVHTSEGCDALLLCLRFMAPRGDTELVVKKALAVWYSAGRISSPSSVVNMSLLRIIGSKLSPSAVERIGSEIPVSLLAGCAEASTAYARGQALNGNWRAALELVNAGLILSQLTPRQAEGWFDVVAVVPPPLRSKLVGFLYFGRPPGTKKPQLFRALSSLARGDGNAAKVTVAALRKVEQDASLDPLIKLGLLHRRRLCVTLAFSILNTRKELFPIAWALERKLRRTDMYDMGLQRMIGALPWERGMAILAELAELRSNVEERWLVQVLSKPAVPPAVFARVHRHFHLVDGYAIVTTLCHYELLCFNGDVRGATESLLQLSRQGTPNIAPALLGRLLEVSFDRWGPNEAMITRRLLNRFCEDTETFEKLGRRARSHLPSVMFTTSDSLLAQTSCGPQLLSYLYIQVSRSQHKPVRPQLVSKALIECATRRVLDWRSALYFFAQLRSPTAKEKVVFVSSLRHCYAPLVPKLVEWHLTRSDDSESHQLRQVVKQSLASLESVNNLWCDAIRVLLRDGRQI